MGQQLALYQGLPHVTARPGRLAVPAPVRVCAGCREKEARYGFRDDPPRATPRRQIGVGSVSRPRTLCFECFRVEIGRRQSVAAQIARGWNASQTSLPLADTLDRLDKQRRRAQIAARHALELR